MFDPANWYWIKEDGSIYSSASRAFVDADDTAFVAWRSAGATPTPYPRDELGNESEAELAAILLPYGIYVRLADYAAAKRYALETGGFVCGGHLIATDRESQSKIGNGALAATVTGSEFATSWKCADGSFIDMNQTGMLAMATAVMKFVSSCFSVEAAVVQGVQAGSITTREAVDSADWPAPSDET
ncbi:DUF4376 domain-containing protein [Rhizobium sp. S153]|uniref:DUF4376 domain-containing protein n=1 Tax=Ciceribacter sichuanensis TaxID=2949647 RepID=A0ABT0V5B5_9HYPH|nr:DUF4376 domain-containing protein [Ciceribacter sp. S153]MCM2399790.1 DUF4376 domain-containing protein [Ciceribacter sp. S153]